MAVDSPRKQEIEQTTGGQQYGQTARLVDFTDAAVGAGAGVIQVSNPVRWGGDRWDVNPWRVYLGPWQPKAGMLITTTDDDIVADFPGVGIPPAMRARERISFAAGLLVWAQVQWGSGGVQHTAWVDWPVAGLLLQVSGSYVQVNAMAASFDVSEHEGDGDPSKFPDLPCTLSDEPGGGDSARSATFTFPLQALDWTTHDGINFPVVPFARAAYFSWNVADKSTVTDATIKFLGPDGDSLEGEYTYAYNAGDIGDPREGVPIPPGTAYVRVEPTFSGATKTFSVGLSYELDL